MVPMASTTPASASVPPVSSDAYEREMAMRQGQLLGIDTVYRIISDAAIVVKRESMRGENGRE